MGLQFCNEQCCWQTERKLRHYYDLSFYECSKVVKVQTTIEIEKRENWEQKVRRETHATLCISLIAVLLLDE